MCIGWSTTLLKTQIATTKKKQQTPLHDYKPIAGITQKVYTYSM